MEWIFDTGLLAYTAIEAMYYATVWDTLSVFGRVWLGRVVAADGSQYSDIFQSADDAKAWCEQQIAALDT
jgi:hypothetical protein